MYELAGRAKIGDVGPLTIYELVQRATGAAKQVWETTSLLAALLHNTHITQSKQAKSANDFNPFTTERTPRKSFDDFVRAQGANTRGGMVDGNSAGD